MLTRKSSVPKRDLPASVQAALPLAEQVRKDIAAWARRTWRRKMGPGQQGLCGFSALLLRKRLVAAGLPAEACVRERHPGKCGPEHAWVALDGYYLDTTATQFWDCPPVLVRPADDPDYHDAGFELLTGDAALVKLREWHAREIWADEPRIPDSPAAKLVRAYNSGTARREPEAREGHLVFAHAKARLLDIILEVGMRVDIEDLCATGALSCLPWMGESRYAQAVRLKHWSFVLAWEKAMGHAPFLLQGRRLHVGARFRWDFGEGPRQAIVTSIDRIPPDSLIACEKHWDFDANRECIVHRARISQAELAACLVQQEPCDLRVS